MSLKLKNIFFTIVNFVLILSLISNIFIPTVFAQNTNLTPTKDAICGGPCPLVDEEFIFDREQLLIFILSIARFLTFIGVGLAVLYMVFAGVQFIIGQKDKAKNNIITTLIGLVIIIVAYTAVNIIVSLLQSNTLGTVLSGSNNF